MESGQDPAQDRPWNLLGLLCSPRRLGNSELLVKELSSRLATEHRLKLLRLPLFRILPCQGCYACLFRDGCTQNDQLGQVLDALSEADALVVAAPAYFLGPNSSLKSLLDRGLSFYSRADSLWGKPAVGAAIAGVPGKEGYTKLAVESFLRCILADIRSSGVFYGAMPGEVLQDRDNLASIGELAEALEGRREAPSGFCPVCGGDTFRFLSPGRVRCLLCNSEGEAESSREGISLRMQQEGGDMHADRERALGHADWLRGMKERYKEKKRELVPLCTAYKSTGEWIEPDPSQ